MTTPAPEWFAAPQPGETEPGLRFECTMCGNCCTGPEGYVLLTDAERDQLAARMNLSVEEFVARYTKQAPRGLSLSEVLTPYGLDCVFLDRTMIPGKAVCGVYEDRPSQCRTWPFWASNLRSRADWDRVKRTCPGMDRGPLHDLVQIRVRRDTIRM